MYRHEVIDEINARLRRPRHLDGAARPAADRAEDLELVLRLAAIRMKESVRSGPATHYQVLRAVNEAEVLALAMVGVKL